MQNFEVKISELIGTEDSPIGPVQTVSSGVWRCDVFHESLPNGMLNVGTIGRQAGANFCENTSFSSTSLNSFTPEQKAFIIEQIKAQHGSASISAPVELPEAIPLEDLYDDEDGEDEDDDLEDTEIE